MAIINLLLFDDDDGGHIAKHFHFHFLDHW